MRVTYDPEVDAAFIYLTPEIARGEVVRSRHFDLEIKNAALIGSLDAEGRLLGLEILGASNLLTGEGLDALRRAAGASGT